MRGCEGSVHGALFRGRLRTINSLTTRTSNARKFLVSVFAVIVYPLRWARWQVGDPERHLRVADVSARRYWEVSSQLAHAFVRVDRGVTEALPLPDPRMVGMGMPEAVYHRRQAEILVRLAQATSDQETSRQLMRLAAEHTALADTDAAHGEDQHDPRTGE